MKMIGFFVVWTLYASLEVMGIRQCQIGIIELNDYLEPGQKCDATQSVLSKDGILQFAADTVDGEDHIYSQHSAPFWLEKAIRASKFYTTDLSKADAIFVNDFCFLVMYIIQLQAGSISEQSVANWVEGYNLLQQTESFQKLNGKNYAVFTPFPPTGPDKIVSLLCSEYGRSLHIAAEAAQQTVCEGADARSNQLLVPYLSARFVEDKEEWPERDIFLYFQGNCGFRDNTHGTQMRNHLVEVVKDLNMTNAAAYCNHDRKVPHDVLRQELRRSLYCPIIPGDTASSRRLTEVMLSGCIPVFIGPPWHTMPLTQQLRYNEFSIFFAVESLARLGKGKMFASNMKAPGSKAPSIFDPWWWAADTDIERHVVHLPDVEGVIHYLKEIPTHSIRQLQEENAKMLSRYSCSWGRPPQGHSLFARALEAADDL